MGRHYPEQKPGSFNLVCVFWGSHRATGEVLFQLILKAR